MSTFMNNGGTTSDRDLLFSWQTELGCKMSIYWSNYTPFCVIY